MIYIAPISRIESWYMASAASIQLISIRCP